MGKRRKSPMRVPAAAYLALALSLGLVWVGPVRAEEQQATASTPTAAPTYVDREDVIEGLLLGYTVQIAGGYRDRDKAEALLAAVRPQFPDARMLTFMHRGELLHRVVSGDYDSPVPAAERQAQLETAGWEAQVRRFSYTAAAPPDGEDVDRHGPLQLSLVDPSAGIAHGRSQGVLRLVRDAREGQALNDGLEYSLFSRPLIFGVDATVAPGYRDHFSLGTKTAESDVRLGLRVEFETLYFVSDRITAFAEVKALHNATVVAEDANTNSDGNLQRGQTWLHVNDIGLKGLALQVGRQRMRDEREWWWDQNLDAIRLHYDPTPAWHFETAVAQELFPVSVDDERIDPLEQNVLRFLAHARWEYRPSNSLELFALRQNDHSRTHKIGEVEPKPREDDDDADLTWFGMRASGKYRINADHKLYYWLDSAYVTGTDRIIDFSDCQNPVKPGNEAKCRAVVGDDVSLENKRLVKEIIRRDVSGWAIDTGATWQTEWTYEPRFTFGYAYGSGDGDPSANATTDDGSFRQTGLEDNNSKWRGVDRFRYYGELLRPELSNLHIGTAAFGFPLLSDSSVEILWHIYRQVEPARFVRSDKIRTDPLGTNRKIGQEIDLVVGLEEWERFEIEWVFAAFRAGDAYGPQEGEMAYFSTLKFQYGF